MKKCLQFIIDEDDIDESDCLPRGEVGVSSDTIRARPKATQSRRHILPQCKQKS